MQTCVHACVWDTHPWLLGSKLLLWPVMTSTTIHLRFLQAPKKQQEKKQLVILWLSYLTDLTQSENAKYVFVPNSLHAKVVLANRLSPFAVLLGQEAIRQPEDTVLTFTFGNQNAQNQDKQDDGGCHSDQVDETSDRFNNRWLICMRELFMSSLHSITWHLELYI